MPGPAAAGGMRGPAVGTSGASPSSSAVRRGVLGSAVRRVVLGVCRPARCPRRLPSPASSSPPGAYAPGLVSASVRKAVQAASLLRSSASCMTA